MRDREWSSTGVEAEAEEPPDPLAELKAQIEQQKLANELAALRRASATDPLGALAVDAAGAPEGKVELGDEAGALAPWLAARSWQDSSAVIAHAVGKALETAEVQSARVLVVTDHDFMTRDLVYHEVITTLARFRAAVTAAQGMLADALPERRIAGTATIATEGETAEPETETEAADAESAEAAGAAATSSPLGLAFDLLKLLRVDYTVSAAEVSVSAGQFADMVAGALAVQDDVKVTRDDLALIGSAGVISTVRSLLDDVVERRKGLLALERTLAPAKQTLAARTARISELQTKWADTAADSPDDVGGLTTIETRIGELEAEVRDLVASTAPAELTVAQVRDLLTMVEAGCTSLIAPSTDGKSSPLRIAAAQEVVKEGPTQDGRQGPVTHVLYVEEIGTRADVTTRRSLVGASDRLHHLASSGATWLLHDAAAGVLVAGGTDSRARQLVYSLSTGETWGRPVFASSPSSSTADVLPRDPSLQAETWVRVAVVALALLVGLAAVLLGLGSIVGLSIDT